WKSFALSTLGRLDLLFGGAGDLGLALSRSRFGRDHNSAEARITLGLFALPCSEYTLFSDFIAELFFISFLEAVGEGLAWRDRIDSESADLEVLCSAVGPSHALSSTNSCGCGEDPQVGDRHMRSGRLQSDRCSEKECKCNKDLIH